MKMQYLCLINLVNSNINQYEIENSDVNDFMEFFHMLRNRSWDLRIRIMGWAEGSLLLCCSVWRESIEVVFEKVCIRNCGWLGRRLSFVGMRHKG